MKLHPHLIDQLAERPISIDDILEALDNEDHREVQPDRRTRVWGWVGRIGKYIRVVIESDGETVLTAFPDRDYSRRKGKS